jgi:hypothetical protein
MGFTLTQDLCSIRERLVESGGSATTSRFAGVHWNFDSAQRIAAVNRYLFCKGL